MSDYYADYELCPLSERELRIMRMICDGFAYKEIGVKLGIAESTVRTHLNTGYKKIGAVNAANAAVIMMRNGWHHHATKEELGLDVKLSSWSDIYLQEFTQFLIGQVEHRHAARIRSRIARMGLAGRRGKASEDDRLPYRLAYMLGVSESQMYATIRKLKKAGYIGQKRHRAACQ